MGGRVVEGRAHTLYPGGGLSGVLKKEEVKIGGGGREGGREGGLVACSCLGSGGGG